MRWIVAGLVAVAVSGAASGARANGRFPAANQLVPGPGRLVVRSTFGLLVGDLPAGPLSWVCEPAIGLPDDQDPPIAVASGGRVWVAPFEGLRRSDEAACAFAPVAGFDAADRLLDVTVERGDAARGVAVAWHPPSRQTRVYGTTDAGASWQLRGALPETDGIPTTIDLAPSQPGRMAVAGSFSDAGTLRGYVSVSDDGGATWSRAVVALAGESGLYLSAFDPLDAARLYARTSGGGTGDRLLVSTDAGLTFAELTRVDGAMLGFALSPDGGQVAVGGPLAGLRVAARGSSSFAAVRPAATTCLAWSQDGLYACGTGTGGDFAVGRSLDAGASWQPVLGRLGDLAPPGVRCAAATPVAAECEPRWPAQDALLDAVGAPGGAAGMSGGSGQTGAGQGGAGQGGAGQGGAGQGGARGEVAIPEDDRGCGCRAAGGEGVGGWWLGLMGLMGLRRPSRPSLRRAEGRPAGVEPLPRVSRPAAGAP